MNDFRVTLVSVDEKFSKRIKLEILQVNLGNMCNQRCFHCHIGAGPKGNKVMSRAIMDDIVSFLSKKEDLVMDITGGCPELNPNFKYLIERSKHLLKQVIVRNNLTIFFEEGYDDLAGFYKDTKIRLICSMPCYTQENVDKQRGKGAFDKSVKALKMLNDLGYGKDKELILDLAYNPAGAFLPGNQWNLERDYKNTLYAQHNIVFNNLLTITNAPIKRFKQYLKANGNFDEYMKLLMDNFNRDVAGDVMCRSLLSVGWSGIIYDCDFNQALGLAIRDDNEKIMEIKALDPNKLESRDIVFENHCFCCTAGAGSSCSGALKQE